MKGLIVGKLGKKEQLMSKATRKELSRKEKGTERNREFREKGSSWIFHSYPHNETNHDLYTKPNDQNRKTNQ